MRNYFKKIQMNPEERILLDAAQDADLAAVADEIAMEEQESVAAQEKRMPNRLLKYSSFQSEHLACSISCGWDCSKPDIS